MNRIPLFITITFLLAIGIIVVGWQLEQQFFRQSSRQPIEPNTFLLGGLALLTLLVLIISALFLFWGLR